MNKNKNITSEYDILKTRIIDIAKFTVDVSIDSEELVVLWPKNSEKLKEDL